MPSLNRDVNEKGDDWIIILKCCGCHGVTKYKKPSVLGLFVYRSTNVLCLYVRACVCEGDAKIDPIVKRECAGFDPTLRVDYC